ncbi:MAG: hypothetical protein M3P08_16535 [Thermoproteota archaeon]|nr:hypothetical protein [Thermoproteota archaeon]
MDIIGVDELVMLADPVIFPPIVAFVMFVVFIVLDMFVELGVSVLPGMLLPD